MPMTVIEYALDANNSNVPKLSLALSTTVGEIRASIVTGPKGSPPLTLFARPTSPVYNNASSAAALAESVLLDEANDTVVTLTILNNGLQPATAKAEITVYSGNRTEHFHHLVDQAGIAIAPGATWATRILIKTMV